MLKTPNAVLSVATLFTEREARHLREKKADDDHLKQMQQERLAEFKQRLDEFQWTEEHVLKVLDRIKRAFNQGETELMLVSFPSSFCTDSGRSIINAGAPPINKPNVKAEKADEPEWLATLPAGVRPVYDYWKNNLEPGGFGFTARIINYPGGMPGDVGVFFSWPKDAPEAQP